MSTAEAVGTDAIRDVRLARTPSPAAIVIFGATGDLTQRKLMPALYSLAVQQLLPPETTIVGVARSELSDDEFRARMRAGVEAPQPLPRGRRTCGTASRAACATCRSPFNEPAGFRRLKALLEELDAERGTRGNRLFYLATAPGLLPGHRRRASGPRGWRRRATATSHSPGW